MGRMHHLGPARAHYYDAEAPFLVEGPRRGPLYYYDAEAPFIIIMMQSRRRGVGTSRLQDGMSSPR